MAEPYLMQNSEIMGRIRQATNRTMTVCHALQEARWIREPVQSSAEETDGAVVDAAMGSSGS
jgi:uncharacterized protein (DUF169 family)